MKRKTAANGAARVLLADSNSLFRVGLRLLLETGKGLKVVGELRSGRIPAKRLRRKDWDLLLIDSGGEPARLATVRKAAGKRSVIALSDDPAPAHALALLQAGADAYVSKRQPPTALLSALLSLKS